MIVQDLFIVRTYIMLLCVGLITVLPKERNFILCITFVMLTGIKLIEQALSDL